MSLDVRPGAVVKVTLVVGQLRWDGELCTVLHVHQVPTSRVAECVSWWSPSQVAMVPVNDLSLELVAPAVPETTGGETR